MIFELMFLIGLSIPMIFVFCICMGYNGKVRTIFVHAQNYTLAAYGWFMLAYTFFCGLTVPKFKKHVQYTQGMPIVFSLQFI